MKAYFLMGIFILFSFTFAKTSENVIFDGNGIYHQSLCEGKYRYVVDSVAQTCYFCSGGVTIMKCEDLAKRTEWKSIITWIDK